MAQAALIARLVPRRLQAPLVSVMRMGQQPDRLHSLVLQEEVVAEMTVARGTSDSRKWL